MSNTVLSVAARAVLDACGQLDLDPDAILLASGLSREQVYDPDTRIPADLADAVWRHAFAQAKNPDLALLAAEALPFGAYKVIDFVVANAPTIGEGLLRVARYFPLIDPRAQITVVEGDPAVFAMSTDGRDVPGPAQQYTFAAVLGRSRAAAGVPWLASVDFTFDAPDDLSTYHRLFGKACRFGQPTARLLIPRSVWNARVEGANEALFSVLDDHAQRLLVELPESEPPFTDLLRRHMREQLCAGDLNIASIAKSMAVSERTLQRRLEDLELSYSKVLSEVRHEVSETYLQEPNVSIAEVAWLLGFSDQSSFSRAFKRWTGRTPGAWKKAHTGSAC